MSKRKSTIRRTNSADTFPNVQEYDRQRKMSGLLGHDELSVLAKNPSYTTTLNDSILPNSGKKDNLQSHREELANLQRILDIPIPGQSEQLEKYDGDGLPPTTKSSRNRKPVENDLDTVSHEVYAPTPGSEKSSSNSQKESIVLKKRTIPNLTIPPRQTYSSATQTFIQTQNSRKSKSKSKSKGGKNKTKKRKAKKTKKNKKTKK